MTGRPAGPSGHHAPVRSVDGFSRPAPAVAHPDHPAASRPSPRPAQAHQLQHSQTLMRQAVHRPQPALKRRLHPSSHTGTLVHTLSFDIAPKHSIDVVDPLRLKHAQHIHKSKLIARFTPATYVPNTPVAPVQPLQAAAPAPQPLPKQPSTDVFERAMAAANSHKEPYHPVKHAKKRHRLRTALGVTASSLVLVLLAGFVAYQNAAAIQFKVASSKAGLNATLPAWQPSGFTVGTFSYGPGMLTVSYHSRVSPSAYSIVQTASSWNSSTLLSEYVYPNNETYNTISSAGTTIYTYGDNDATCVSGGIWYKLTSHGALSTSQIVNIATSMQT